MGPRAVTRGEPATAAGQRRAAPGNRGASRGRFCASSGPKQQRRAFCAEEEQRWVWWVELHYLERLRHAPSPPERPGPGGGGPECRLEGRASCARALESIPEGPRLKIEDSLKKEVFTLSQVQHQCVPSDCLA